MSDNFISYKCIESVRMKHNGSIAFTKGRTYHQDSVYGNGLMFTNNNSVDHQIPYKMLHKHFKKVIQDDLNINIL